MLSKSVSFSATALPVYMSSPCRLKKKLVSMNIMPIVPLKIVDVDSKQSNVVVKWAVYAVSIALCFYRNIKL